MSISPNIPPPARTIAVSALLLTAAVAGCQAQTRETSAAAAEAALQRKAQDDAALGSVALKVGDRPFNVPKDLLRISSDTGFVVEGMLPTFRPVSYSGDINASGGRYRAYFYKFLTITVAVGAVSSLSTARVHAALRKGDHYQNTQQGCLDVFLSKAPHSRFTDDAFVPTCGSPKGAQDGLITCTPLSRRTVHAVCQDQFAYNGLRASLTYHRDNLGNWAQLRALAVCKLNEMSVGAHGGCDAVESATHF